MEWNLLGGMRKIEVARAWSARRSGFYFSMPSQQMERNALRTTRITQWVTPLGIVRGYPAFSRMHPWWESGREFFVTGRDFTPTVPHGVRFPAVISPRRIVMRTRHLRSSDPTVAAVHSLTVTAAFQDSAVRKALADHLRRWRACPTGPESIRRCVRDWRRCNGIG